MSAWAATRSGSAYTLPKPPSGRRRTRDGLRGAHAAGPSSFIVLKATTGKGHLAPAAFQTKREI
ncbi:hypothetical protein DFAR_1750010 [Desulfarculales bacterium]